VGKQDSIIIANESLSDFRVSKYSVRSKD